MGGGPGDTTRRLVLLVDHDVESRRHTRQLLELHGLEVVQVSNGVAALELIQRLPESFRLVIAEMDLPGLSGVVVKETLRLFRPDLPTICISDRAWVADARQCLPKPLDGAHLRAIMQGEAAFPDGGGQPGLPETSLARARARFATAGDLVEAALELARTVGPED